MLDHNEFLGKCLESAAYHEAGHEVVSVILQIPIQESGIHVDSQIHGIALTFLRTPEDLRNTPADIVEREQSIVVLNAGYIAQKLFFPDTLPESGAQD